jgi:hypothetical protein
MGVVIGLLVIVVIGFLLVMIIRNGLLGAR